VPSDDASAAPPPTVIEILDPPSAPAALAPAEEVDAPPPNEAISGLAALYASAREFTDTAVLDEGAALAAIGAEDADLSPADVASAVSALDSSNAPSLAETVSGLAALYESAAELSDAEPRGDGAGATLPPSIAEDDRWASVRASLAPTDDVVDVAPPPSLPAAISGFASLYNSAETSSEVEDNEAPAAPLAPSSGLTAALYESTGDAPELESEAFAAARAPAVEAPTESAMEAFNRTLAEAAEVVEAAKLASPPAQTASTRGFLPIFTAQRLAQSQK
jgi:hypothetical protein